MDLYRLHGARRRRQGEDSRVSAGCVHTAKRALLPAVPAWLHNGQKQGVDRLQVDKFIGLLFLWAHEAPIKMVLSMTGVSSDTAVQWYRYFRDICSWKLVNSPTTLGGPGKIVQIDESVMVKAKYHWGHQLPAKQRWMFGIYIQAQRRGTLSSLSNGMRRRCFPSSSASSLQEPRSGRTSGPHTVSCRH